MDNGGKPVAPVQKNPSVRLILVNIGHSLDVFELVMSRVTQKYVNSALQVFTRYDLAIRNLIWMCLVFIRYLAYERHFQDVLRLSNRAGLIFAPFGVKNINHSELTFIYVK